MACLHDGSIYSFAMRSWFATLLMLAVTLQFAWAAAANYCWHEPSGVTHLGHHVHQHDGEHAQAHKSLGKAGQSQADLDHGHCHLASAVVVDEAGLPQAAILPELHASAPPLANTSHIPEGLERPNWQRA